jgi:butyryl-CoA dehydrogenase
MARAALVARQRLTERKGEKSFYEAKIKTARFYADHVLTQAPALRNAIVRGSGGVMALEEDQF